MAWDSSFIFVFPQVASLMVQTSALIAELFSFNIQGLFVWRVLSAAEKTHWVDLCYGSLQMTSSAGKQ